MIKYLAVLLLLCIGCKEDLDNIQPSSTIQLGMIVDANFIESNDWPNTAKFTKVVCEKRIVYIYGLHSTPFNKRATIYEYPDGQAYLTWEQSKRIYRVKR